MASVMCAKVDVRQVVRRPVVVLVQTEARDGLRDHAPVGQLNVVRSQEEVLVGPWVRDELRTAFRQFRPEIRSLVASQPQRMRRHPVVGPADHLEFQIGDDLIERHRRSVRRMRGPRIRPPLRCQTRRRSTVRLSRGPFARPPPVPARPSSPTRRHQRRCRWCQDRCRERQGGPDAPSAESLHAIDCDPSPPVVRGRSTYDRVGTPGPCCAGVSTVCT